MRNSCYCETPLGTIRITEDDGAIVALDFVSCSEPQCEVSESPVLQEAVHQLKEYFSGQRKSFDLPLAAQGTAFQKAVWNALCTIPYGETRSYKQIAEQVGNPKGCRAVGMANNRNPIGIIVPCHRVVGADGKLVGYAGGLDVKAALLRMEREGGAL